MAEETLKPAEWEKLLTWAQDLIGHQLPSYIKIPLGILVLSALIVSILLITIAAVSKIKEIWLEKLLPYTYRAEQRQRVSNRRTFASYLSREIVNRNIAERWRDEEFADLEAEVEAEGDWRSFLPFVHRRGLRREKSLRRALERSTERLILLEGEPGSGKSVALRHVAYRMSEAAAHSSHLDTRLPIFVNLKEIKRAPDQPINRSLIRDLVFETITRVNDHFVDEFLDENFDDGVKNGLFVFLFDSFDEIPEILSSTQADNVIDTYSRAISDFLSGMNECRGIIASRSYKGPERQGWRTFRILELSSARQQTLARRAFPLAPELAPKLVGELSLAQEDVRAMARNPMLLGLLCEHMRLGNEFPSSAYEVFSHYVEHRFKRDAERVKSRHGLSTDDVRAWAERVAFVMTSDPALGLSPRRGDLRSALRRAYPRLSFAVFDSALDALEYIKFGRSDGSTEIGNRRQFTFSHRRFQEYFTTRVAIAQPARVSPRQLLTDARWRETAVVLLQSGSDSERTAILAESAALLESAVQLVRSSAPEQALGEPAVGEAAADSKAVTQLRRRMKWPSGILHVLGIIQAGLGSRAIAIPENVATLSAELFRLAIENGDLLDRKLALEVAGTAPQEVLLELIRSSLTIDSQWLNDVTYSQIARLSDIPKDVISWIRGALLRWGLSGQLARNWHGVRTHLLRLGPADGLISSARMARWVVKLDLLACISLVVALTYYSFGRSPRGLEIIFFLFSILATTGLIYLYWAFWGNGSKFLRTISILYLLIVVYVVGSAKELSYIVTILMIFIAAYLTIYGPAAARCASRGLFVSPPLWPLSPLVYILDFARFARQYPKPLMLTFLAITVIGIVGYKSKSYLQEALDWYTNLFNKSQYLSLGIGLLMGIAILSRLIKYVMTWVRDARKFKSISKLKATMEPQEFCSTYTSLGTPIWQSRFLRRIRIQNNLKVNEESERVIRECIDRLRGSSPDQRDELYMLLENVTRDQRSSSPAAAIPLTHNVAVTGSPLSDVQYLDNRDRGPDDLKSEAICGRTDPATG